MIRQDIRIGDYSNIGITLTSYKYIIDFYKHDVDDISVVYKNFVMLRKYNIINDIVYDTDIYFIDKGLFDENGKLKEDATIIYPATNGSFIGFSQNPASFNEFFNKSSVSSLDSDDIYHIYKLDDDNVLQEDADIPCNEIRIYHPHNKNELQSLIYVDVVVNSIRFHLLCQPYLDYETYSDADIDIEKIKYSEYIKIYIPDMDYILDAKNKIYYKEDITDIDTIILPDNNEQTTGLVSSDLVVIDSNNDIEDNYASFNLFTIPFMIDDTNHKQFIKKYVIDPNDDVARNYITYPVRVMIYPYDFIDETTKIYINNSTIQANSDVFYADSSMSLAAEIGWPDTQVPSLICRFQFPGKNRFNTFAEAYEYYYRVNLNDYDNIFEYDDEEDEDDEDIIEQKQCGFMLVMYSDYKMTQVVDKETFEISNPNNTLDDFAFQLNNMFPNWDALPETLIMRAFFIDKYLGNIIPSNPVTVPERLFKYLVCDDPQKRSIVNWNYNSDYTNMDTNNINFIDKISCTIRRKNDDKQNINLNGIANTPTVVYRPIFYRVNDLQNIVIRSGLTQNIGISLAEYMTKVESFVLHINNQEYYETARNDIYAIFNINGGTISTTSGTYHITNQDGEYISTGNYTVVN